MPMRPNQPSHAFSLILVVAILAITAVAYYNPGSVTARPLSADQVRLADPVQGTLRAARAPSG